MTNPSLCLVIRETIDKYTEDIVVDGNPIRKELIL